MNHAVKYLPQIILIALHLSVCSSAQDGPWQKCSNGLPDSAIVSALDQCKGNLIAGIWRATGQTYYIPGGFYISSDSGKSWIARNIVSVYSGEVLPISSFLVIEDTIFAGIPGEGIYRTTKEGTTWTKSDSGIFGNGFGICGFLRLDSVLFVSTQNGVYRSEDYGRHWRLKSNGIPLNWDGYPFPARVMISIGRQVYAGVDAGFQGQGGLFLTSDLGETWTKVLQNRTYGGAPITTDVYAIDYFDGCIYLGVNGFWLLKSNDGGKSWSEDDLYRSAWLLYDFKDRLFLNNTPFLWTRSVGGNWRDVTLNLPNEIWSMHGFDSMLYVGLRYNGVWKSTLSSITEVRSLAEKDQIGFCLYQNYPNPFNPSTTIRFSVPARSQVRLTVYNLLGQKVSEILDEEMNPGSCEMIWNAKVASGQYFCRIEAVSVSDPSKRFVDVKKMILMK